jgi:hypothetical protein
MGTRGEASYALDRRLLPAERWREARGPRRSSACDFTRLGLTGLGQPDQQLFCRSAAQLRCAQIALSSPQPARCRFEPLSGPGLLHDLADPASAHA